MIIYEDGDYQIEKTSKGHAEIVCSGKVVCVHLRDPEAIPAQVVRAMRQNGMDTGKYFFAGGAPIRIAAKASWCDAVRDARVEAEREIDRGQEAFARVDAISAATRGEMDRSW